MIEACGWLTYDEHGNEYVFANRDDAERFVGDSDDAETLHPLIMSAEADGLRIELDLHRSRIAELEREVFALQTERYEAEQLLGKALGYPILYPDARPIPDGSVCIVCIGDHILTTIAAEAANKIASLSLYERRWETMERLATIRESPDGENDIWCVQIVREEESTFAAAVDNASREGGDKHAD